MTDNGATDDRPLPLGVLAQTESPEIVRAALGRFRRRLVIRGLILLLAVGAGFILYPRYFDSPKELSQEIRDSRGEVLVKTIDAGDVDAVVFRAARLSKQPGRHDPERFGIFLAASSDSLKPGEQMVVTRAVGKGVLQIQSGIGNPNIQGVEVWISAAAGTRFIDVPFLGVASDGSGISVRHRSLGTLSLDMELLNVPDWIWR